MCGVTEKNVVDLTVLCFTGSSKAVPSLRSSICISSRSGFGKRKLEMASSSNTFVVAVIGVGLVGAEFVDQLLNLRSSSIKLVSLSSSKINLFISDGLGVNSNWRKALSESNLTSNVEELIEKIRGLLSKGGSKAIVVDNTSSDVIANFYPTFLKNGFHVITPNKKAFSSSLSLYKDIIDSSKYGEARFLNESTVGAGLPVISTLKDLVNTGDEVSLYKHYFEPFNNS